MDFAGVDRHMDQSTMNSRVYIDRFLAPSWRKGLITVITFTMLNK